MKPDGKARVCKFFDLRILLGAMEYSLVRLEVIARYPFRWELLLEPMFFAGVDGCLR